MAALGGRVLHRRLSCTRLGPLKQHDAETTRVILGITRSQDSEHTYQHGGALINTARRRCYAGDSSASVQSRGAGSAPSSLTSASRAACCTAAHGLSAQPAPACDVSECSKPSTKKNARQ